MVECVKTKSIPCVMFVLLFGTTYVSKLLFWLLNTARPKLKAIIYIFNNITDDTPPFNRSRCLHLCMFILASVECCHAIVKNWFLYYSRSSILSVTNDGAVIHSSIFFPQLKLGTDQFLDMQCNWCRDVAHCYIARK